MIWIYQAWFFLLLHEEFVEEESGQMRYEKAKIDLKIVPNLGQISQHQVILRRFHQKWLRFSAFKVLSTGKISWALNGFWVYWCMFWFLDCICCFFSLDYSFHCALFIFPFLYIFSLCNGFFSVCIFSPCVSSSSGSYICVCPLFVCVPSLCVFSFLISFPLFRVCSLSVCTF